jgi:hypothetical protein
MEIWEKNAQNRRDIFRSWIHFSEFPRYDNKGLFLTVWNTGLEDFKIGLH